MSLPRYPAYKDSGVPWLGEVPAHWGVKRFKSIVAESKGGIWGEEPQGNDADIVCVRVADFDRVALRVRLDEPTLRNVTEREREGRLLRRGDLLLEKSGGGEGQLVGCVVLYDHDVPAVCSNFIGRLGLVEGASPGYWAYVFASAYDVRLNYQSVRQTSGIQNLDQAEYLNELAPIPPLAEQEAIAAFLDRETARVDALVAEQGRLIALLKEKRQAVISHAVTRGLNPDAPRKPSGIDWVGDIPTHWSSVRNKSVFVEVDDRTVANEGELLTVSHITGVTPRSEKDVNMFMAETLEGYKKCAPGDLVINTMLSVRIRPLPTFNDRSAGMPSAA